MFEEIKQHKSLVRDQIFKGIVGGEELLVKAHNVGDVHPNGKWVWTQLSNGKYDWRVKKNASGAQEAAGGHKGSDQEEPKGKQPKNASSAQEAASSQGIKSWKDLTKKEKDAAYTTTHDLLKEKLKNTNNESLSWRQGGYEIVQKLSKVYGEKRALKLVLDEASAFQGASQGFIFNTYIKLRVQGYSDEDANKITRNTYKHIAGRDWIDG